jgi:LysM repeat protein
MEDMMPYDYSDSSEIERIDDEFIEHQIDTHTGGSLDIVSIEYPESKEHINTITVIPGTGKIINWLSWSRKPRVSAHLLVIIVIASIVSTSLFSVLPLTESDNPLSGTSNPFVALADMFVVTPPSPFFSYTVLSDDTIQSIAEKFHVQIGGIYKANKYTAVDEPSVGDVIQVPRDPNYGADYYPPLPEGMKRAGYNATNPPLNVLDPGNDCMWCAVPGETNGTDGICAVPAAPADDAPLAFGLQSPELGQNYHFSKDQNGQDRVFT